MAATIPKTLKAWKIKKLLAPEEKFVNITDVFDFVEEPIAELKDGEILVQTEHLGLEPTMRNSITTRKSYSPPPPVGSVMWCFSLATVIASKDANYPVGALIFTNGVGMATHGTLNPGALGTAKGGAVIFQLVAKSKDDKPDFDPREYLSSFGPPGLAAYVGLFSPKVGNFREGDIVLVDGAAGATGSLVIQMAKARGAARVIGIASGKKKQAVLDAGADAFVAYDQDDFVQKLHEATEDKVTLLFENAGGKVLDAAIECMADYGRIALCGLISEYDGVHVGPDFRGHDFRPVLIKRLTVSGYICSDPQVACDQVNGILQLLKEKKIHSAIHAFQPDGIESVPKALQGLFEGQNTGKMTVKINTSA